MCLGIPGRVTTTYREHDVLMGKVEFGGISRKVCLEHVPDVRVDEYVLVHVGFALSKIDEVEARRVFQFLEGMNQLDELGSTTVAEIWEPPREWISNDRPPPPAVGTKTDEGGPS